MNPVPTFLGPSAGQSPDGRFRPLSAVGEEPLTLPPGISPHQLISDAFACAIESRRRFTFKQSSDLSPVLIEHPNPGCWEGNRSVSRVEPVEVGTFAYAPDRAWLRCRATFKDGGDPVEFCLLSGGFNRELSLIPWVSRAITSDQFALIRGCEEVITTPDFTLKLKAPLSADPFLNRHGSFVDGLISPSGDPIPRPQGTMNIAGTGRSLKNPFVYGLNFYPVRKGFDFVVRGDGNDSYTVTIQPGPTSQSGYYCTGGAPTVLAMIDRGFDLAVIDRKGLHLFREELPLEGLISPLGRFSKRFRGPDGARQQKDWHPGFPAGSRDRRASGVQFTKEDGSFFLRFKATIASAGSSKPVTLERDIWFRRKLPLADGQSPLSQVAPGAESFFHEEPISMPHGQGEIIRALVSAGSLPEGARDRWIKLVDPAPVISIVTKDGSTVKEWYMPDGTKAASSGLNLKDYFENGVVSKVRWEGDQRIWLRAEKELAPDQKRARYVRLTRQNGIFQPDYRFSSAQYHLHQALQQIRATGISAPSKPDNFSGFLMRYPDGIRLSGRFLGTNSEPITDPIRLPLGRGEITQLRRQESRRLSDGSVLHFCAATLEGGRRAPLVLHSGEKSCQVVKPEAQSLGVLRLKGEILDLLLLHATEGMTKAPRITLDPQFLAEQIKPNFQVGDTVGYAVWTADGAALHRAVELARLVRFGANPAWKKGVVITPASNLDALNDGERRIRREFGDAVKIVSVKEWLEDRQVSAAKSSEILADLADVELHALGGDVRWLQAKYDSLAESVSSHSSPRAAVGHSSVPRDWRQRIDALCTPAGLATLAGSVHVHHEHFSPYYRPRFHKNLMRNFSYAADRLSQRIDDLDQAVVSEILAQMYSIYSSLRGKTGVWSKIDAIRRENMHDQAKPSTPVGGGSWYYINGRIELRPFNDGAFVEKLLRGDHQPTVSGSRSNRSRSAHVFGYVQQRSPLFDQVTQAIKEKPQGPATISVFQRAADELSSASPGLALDEAATLDHHLAGIAIAVLKIDNTAVANAWEDLTRRESASKQPTLADVISFMKRFPIPERHRDSDRPDLGRPATLSSWPIEVEGSTFSADVIVRQLEGVRAGLLKAVAPAR